MVRVDRVEWLNLRDPQSAALALAAGEVDFVENPGVEFLPMLEAAGTVVGRKDSLGTQGILRMNHLQPPFNDARARQALAHLVDQREMLQAMFGNPDIVRPCGAYFACGSPLGTAAGVSPPAGSDPRRARELFQQAGYDGTPIVILRPTDIQFMNIGTLVLASRLKAIGVAVDLQAMDFGTMAARRLSRAPPSRGCWHLGMTYWPASDLVDPVGNVPLQSSCDAAWAGWPCDAPLQAMIDQFAAAQDDDARRELAARIQARASETVPYVPLGEWLLPVAHSPLLEGVLEIPATTVFWNISKSPVSADGSAR